MNSILQRRRALIEKKNNRLPAEFQLCEWIQIQNGATNNYLITDIPGGPITKAEFVLTKHSQRSGMVISTNKSSPFGALNNSQSAYVCSPSVAVGEMVLEDTLFTFTKSAGSQTGNVTLFSWNTVSWVASMRIKQAKLYAGDALVFDGVPAYRRLDDMPGLWDKVSSKFNEATSNYSKGADV